MDDNLTRDEMINLMNANPYLAFKHRYFGEDEYIYSDGIYVRDENNYIFEDWNTPDHNGLRLRTGGAWESDWSVVPHIKIQR